jgi:hypothetical protein
VSDTRLPLRIHDLILPAEYVPPLVAQADADYVLRWLEQTDAPENIRKLQRRAVDTLTTLALRGTR